MCIRDRWHTVLLKHCFKSIGKSVLSSEHLLESFFRRHLSQCHSHGGYGELIRSQRSACLLYTSRCV